MLVDICKDCGGVMEVNKEHILRCPDCGSLRSYKEIWDEERSERRKK